MRKLYVWFALLTMVAAPVWAAPRTVTLVIPGMTCAACPITVKQALSRVDGVTKTEVRFDQREVVVTFDDQRTNVRALAEATKNAGYPSTLKGANH